MSENLDALRAWYDANKTTPDFVLAMKHRSTFGPGVAEALKAKAPGDSDEEKELGLIFALTQVAAKLDLHAILLAGITADMFTPLAKPVPVSHVDVVPLEPPSKV